MREIKFRAWDSVNKRFIKHRDIECGIKNMNNKSHLILEQYTGIKDKCSVEIYEGDILDNPLNVVGFSFGCFNINSDRIVECPYIHKIIGNIHENPEPKGE